MLLDCILLPNSTTFQHVFDLQLLFSVSIKQAVNFMRAYILSILFIVMPNKQNYVYLFRYSIDIY